MVKILVIEDEKPLLESVLDILYFENFEALGVSSGIEGIELAQVAKPDLILCDIMMPELDGYEVLLELQSNPATASIPFIFLTAKAEKSDLRRGMELGADDYLTKPFTQIDLLNAIHSRLEKHNMLTKLSEDRLEILRRQIMLALPHELRTPLTAILGYSELMMDDPSTLTASSIEQMSRSIHKSALRLFRLSENYLTCIQIALISDSRDWIERLQKGYTENPDMVIGKSIIAAAEKAERQDDLKLTLTGAASVKIHSDYLRKIVEELIDNAFKFSKTGSFIEARTWADPTTYHIEIRDCGRGMTEEQLAEIGAFMQFERRVYEQQGTGLGLVIARRLIELHAGQFDVKSSSGKGTIVHFSLPR